MSFMSDSALAHKTFIIPIPSMCVFTYVYHLFDIFIGFQHISREKNEFAKQRTSPRGTFSLKGSITHVRIAIKHTDSQQVSGAPHVHIATKLNDLQQVIGAPHIRIATKHTSLQQVSRAPYIRMATKHTSLQQVSRVPHVGIATKHTSLQKVSEAPHVRIATKTRVCNR